MQSIDQESWVIEIEMVVQFQKLRVGLEFYVGIKKILSKKD